MASKRMRIKYAKERAILSDTLPFEVPPTFSNKDFYKFIKSHDVHRQGDKLYWKCSGLVLDTLLKLVFGIDQVEVVEKIKKNIAGREIVYSRANFGAKATKPFLFEIAHKEYEYRQLFVPHPKTQFYVIDFYDSYKETILYYSGLDSFSLRRPCKVAGHVYYSDKLHIDRFDRSTSEIETVDKEYENLKSFFVYRKYSNIYKFYESFEFHRLEKKYNNLLKLDISKCFDSIYSHSIAWAIYGKDVIKSMYLEPRAKTLESTFAGEFDALMQSLNGRETNGIIIGPEISRIFAELILQRVDRNTIASISKADKSVVRYSEYDVLRYMDDYFVFYNEESTMNLVLATLQQELQEFKFYLNSAKAKIYEKPIITEITIAKNRISVLLDSWLKYSLTQEDDKWTGRISFPSKKVITEFKTIIKESDVKYKDLLNWTLALVETKLDKAFKDYLKIEESPLATKEVSNLILNVTEFVFFIYSVTPRVNTTLRLCRIIAKVKIFIGKHLSNRSFRHTVFREIQQNIIFLFKKFKHSKLTQVETLYLLVLLSQFENYYALSEEQLCDYF